jgi:DNA-binding GntR family transcriptional regulator
MGEMVNQTLENKVLQLLRQRILDGAMGFEPGARLFVTDLARDLGVSSTPIQHAIKSLRMEGLVDIRPRRGTYVARLEPGGIRKIWEAVLAIQIGCLTTSIERVRPDTLGGMRANVTRAERWLANKDWHGYLDEDVEFHRLLVSIANNSLLIAAYDSLVTRLYPLARSYAVTLQLGQGTDGIAGHHRIIEFLERDEKPEIIRELSEDHRRSVGRLLLVNPDVLSGVDGVAQSG